MRIDWDWGHWLAYVLAKFAESHWLITVGALYCRQKLREPLWPASGVRGEQRSHSRSQRGSKVKLGPSSLWSSQTKVLGGESRLLVAGQERDKKREASNEEK